MSANLGEDVANVRVNLRDVPFSLFLLRCCMVLGVSCSLPFLFPVLGTFFALYLLRSLEPLRRECERRPWLPLRERLDLWQKQTKCMVRFTVRFEVDEIKKKKKKTFGISFHFVQITDKMDNQFSSSLWCWYEKYYFYIWAKGKLLVF